MLFGVGGRGERGRRIYKPASVEGLEERVLMAMSLKVGGSGYSNLLASDTASVRQQKLIIDPPDALAGSVSTLYDASKVTVTGAAPGPGYENANFQALVEVRSPTGATRLQLLPEFLQRPLGTETGYVQLHFQLTGTPGKVRLPGGWAPIDIDGTDGTDPASIDFTVRPDVSLNNLFAYRSYAAKEGEHGNPEDFLLTNDGTQTRIGPGLLSATDSSNRPTDGSIAGNVFEDFNGDLEKTGDDRGLPDVIVYLDLDRDGKLEDNEPRQVTNEIGGYVFDDLKPGDYLVREVPPRGYVISDVDASGVPTTVRAGQRPRINFSNSRPATISGTVFNDVNSNGAADAGEGGVAGAFFFVDKNNDGLQGANEPGATSAGPSGAWTIGPLPAGRYVVRQALPSGWVQTFPASNGTQVVTVSSGSTATGITFGDHFRAPKVLEVFVRSSSWSSAFQKELARLQLGDGASGYRIFPTRLPALLPWVNLNQFVVRFDQPVDATASALAANGMKNDRAGLSVAPVANAPGTYVFTLNAPLLGDGSVRFNGDRFVLSVDGDLRDGVRSIPANGGVPLDGDNDNVVGGDFILPFNVLEGDVNHSGGVNVTDYALTLRRLGSSAGATTRYSVFNDLDGNGAINFTDLGLVRGRIGRILPAVQAPAAVTLLGVEGDRRTTRRALFGNEPVLL
jgi:hypothetical protein